MLKPSIVTVSIKLISRKKSGEHQGDQKKAKQREEQDEGA